jgi:hypothetical protein
MTSITSALPYEKIIEVGLAADPETLRARLVEAAERLGFGISGGALIRGQLQSRKASVHSFGNPPDGFAEVFTSLDLGIADPLMTAMQARPGVYVYDQEFYVKAGAGQLWELQSPFGYKHGMAVSLHETSHAETFCFGVDGPDAISTAASARFGLESQLRLLALHAHEAARRLWTTKPAVDLNAVTGEERSALKWARDGVCVWVTGDKLVYSNPGLVKAQASAARKLGTTGPGAVLRAIDGGLID